MIIVPSKIFSSVPHKTKIIIYAFSFNSVATGYLMLVLTAYLPQIGISSATVGLLIGVEGIVMILAGIPLGILSDRKGRKNILLLGSIAITPSMIIFAFTTNFLLLILSAIIFGLGESAALTTWNAIIADQTGLESRDAAFSLSFIIMTISFALGSLVPLSFPSLQMLLALDSSTIHKAFLIIFGVLSLTSPIWSWFSLRGYIESPRQTKFIKGKNFSNLLKFSGINGLIGLGAGFIIPLIPTWLYLKFSISDTYSGPLLAISYLTISLATVVSPRVSGKYGLVSSIVGTQGLSTIFMLSLAFVQDPISAGGIYIVRAALMNMSAPLSDSYLMGIMSSQERGLASAINSIIWRLPNGIGTIVGGLILESGSFTILSRYGLLCGLYIYILPNLQKGKPSSII